MDGKLVVLCDERPTINKYGDPIGENKDTHKRVISGIDLLNEMYTESIKSDVLFVDWETVVPSDIGILEKMQQYAKTTDSISPEFILDCMRKQSLMQRAYLDRLTGLDKLNMRPRMDYNFMAMDDFMKLLADSLYKNGAVKVLPAYKTDQEADINIARNRVIQTWSDNNKLRLQREKKTEIKLLPGMEYTEFGEVYTKAQEEYMKIIGEPYDFEENNDLQNDDGGR
ncbi:MAG: hypothetical protein HFJ17_00625 [Clostridia bacterium]|nr:hypothetical protein [Clostridia bacterium]